MFLAGHETTATALAWTWYLLCRHPEKAENFYEEINRTLGGRFPDHTDYNTLSYTKLVFKEALRLYPPVWTVAREATEDLEILGYHFPKGAVLCSVFPLLHRDAKYYRTPLEFIPERWEDAGISSNPRLAYVPFGAGNRICIGQGFAWMEAVMIMATMASRFKFALPDGFETNEKIAFTLKPEKEIVVQLSDLKFQAPG